MDVAWLAEFRGGEHVFRGVDGDQGYFGVPVGEGVALEGSYCQRMVDGRDVALMHVLAESVASHIERDQMEAERQQVRSELDAVGALLAALEARDAYTGEHSRTVVELAGAVARDLGLSSVESQQIEQVALLHDLGKVGVPDAVLQKRGPLTPLEW